MTVRPSDPENRNTETKQSPAQQTRRPDRRTVLRTAGFVALAGGGAAAFAACSSGTPATSPSTEAAPTSAAPSSAAPSASPSAPASSSAPSSAAAPTGPSVAAADVPVGSGVIMADPDKYVVTQPTKGEYKAFTAVCTHSQCKVSEMRGDVIHCGCHQSDFSIKDGSVVNPPAQEPLEEFKTTVSGGKVYVQA